MAHGLNSVLKRVKSEGKGVGSRRIFAPHFKLQVLDSYRRDADCKGNQRATARKYGIHRRQIQKWLQVEAALRSSVQDRPGDDAVALGSARQRGDAPRARCPSPVAPMDLSLKRPAPAPPSPACRAPPSPPRPVGPLRPHPEVWDLSTTRRSPKRRRPSEEGTRGASPKPVKLFKPYLDVAESDGSGHDTPPSIVKLEPVPCCSAAVPEAYCYAANNNECEYGSYTLLELQPSPGAYFYNYAAYPDYDAYQEPPLKQRQSYSLDFKLSAIDCYYRDAACRGNQRAVASKYNVHRRQVQKWLKQAEELRSRNDAAKQPEVR